MPVSGTSVSVRQVTKSATRTGRHDRTTANPTGFAFDRRRTATSALRQTTRVTEDEILQHLRQLEIETPSWAYGNSGTRFHVYPWPGAARDVYERIADAALVHQLTGCCPSVAIHIPWDRVDDWYELRTYAESQGLRIGAVNPNLFGDDAYRLGSFCHPDPAVRRRALDHCLESVANPAQGGSSLLSLSLAG